MSAASTSGSADGFDSITLTSADGSTTAEFVPAANMLCCSFTVDGDELLDLRHGVRAYAEQGKTMGIPLLYPWANRLEGFGYRAAGKEVTLSTEDARIPRDGNGLPIHGVLPGLLSWEVEASGSGAGDAVAARLAWRSEDLLGLFPFAHEVSLSATVGRAELMIATTVTAGGDGPVPVSFGYHPYTRVPGAGRDDWQVTLGASSQIVLDGHSIPTGERAAIERLSFALGGVSLDDAYDAAAAPAKFAAAAGGTTLTVDYLSGYSFAQVFAPPGQEFICFEPMTAPTNALNSGDGLTVLAAGESYGAEFRIALSRGRLMPAGGVRLACCQIAPDVVHPAESRDRALDAIAGAVAAGAQIIVLPELVTSGYVFESVEEARAALPAGGGSFADWAREAGRGDAVVIGGFCELVPDGRLFNSSALVDGDGLRAVYRKLHLWGEEPRWFSAGDRPPPVVDTRHGRIGLAVCYDIEFPELPRGLALAGAELIALPANWPRDPTPILHALALTTAYLSRVYVAVCDRCGSERGLEFEGGSVIAGPDGALRAGPVADRGVKTLIADCDLDDARRKRNGPHNDAFADRRPAYYAKALAGD